MVNWVAIRFLKMLEVQGLLKDICPSVITLLGKAENVEKSLDFSVATNYNKECSNREKR